MKTHKVLFVKTLNLWSWSQSPLLATQLHQEQSNIVPVKGLTLSESGGVDILIISVGLIFLKQQEGDL